VKLHLVDGTFELFRAYYGRPGALSPSGMEVGATRGLMASLAALAAEPEVSHVAVAFDHVVESFRNQLFAGYKTGEGIEPALYAQFGLAEEATAALGFVVWSMVEFEADDAVATAAARFGDQVEQVVICSPDKDFAQCVRGQRVVCLDRIRRGVLDEPGVQAKFGIPPAAIPDYLALVGDSADGIPGVPRWGSKSAATLLARYGTIEAIPDRAADWDVKVRGAEVLATNLSLARDDARLYRRLATLRTDVPLMQDLSALAYRGPDPAALHAFCARVGERPERFARLGSPAL
jgi:5'-3' exonuclease